MFPMDLVQFLFYSDSVFLESGCILVDQRSQTCGVGLCFVSTKHKLSLCIQLELSVVMMCAPHASFILGLSQPLTVSSTSTVV